MKKCVWGMVAMVSLFSYTACSEIDILSPPGTEGKNAYEVWVQAVNDGVVIWESGTDLPNYFKYLKSESTDGMSAYEEWKAYIQSGDVEDPHNPDFMWNPERSTVPDFFYFLSGAKGEDGMTPYIRDGNWYIGTADMGVAAAGDKVEIVDDYWYINGEKTDVQATGSQGTQGPAGQSAYVIWRQEVIARTIKDKEGNKWPTTATSLQDFWAYLKGADGELVTLEKTPLTFLSSDLQDGSDYEEFRFTTAPNATVTMNYQSTTASSAADENGVCVINFPVSETEEQNAIVYAKADSMATSDPISVKVHTKKIHYVLDIYYDIEWYDTQTNAILDNSTGTYGDLYTITDENDMPYIVMYGRTYPLYIRIRFTSENIKSIWISESSGLAQFYVRIIPDTPEDYSSGVIEVRPASSGPIGDTDITITALTDKQRPVITTTFRVRNIAKP